MPHRPPCVFWDRRRPEQGPSGPALTIPADLTSLSADAREDLRLRLATRTAATVARIRGTGADSALVLVGLTDAHVTPQLQTAVDYLVATVGDEAATGRPAQDERPGPARRPSAAAQHLTHASRAHRPILGRRLIGPFSLFSSGVFAVGLAAFLAVSAEAGIALIVLAAVIRSAEAYDAWTRLPAPPPGDRRR